VIRTCFPVGTLQQNRRSVSRIKFFPLLVGGRKSVIWGTAGQHRQVRIYVVPRGNPKVGGRFLPNSGKLVLVKSCDFDAELRQIRIDRIFWISMERIFAQGNLRIRVIDFKLPRRGVGPGRDFGFGKP